MVFSNIEKIQHFVSLDCILNTSLFPKQLQLQKEDEFFGNTEVLIGSTNTESQHLHINLSWRNCVISVDTAPTPFAWITRNRPYVRELRKNQASGFYQCFFVTLI